MLIKREWVVAVVCVVLAIVVLTYDVKMTRTSVVALVVMDAVDEPIAVVDIESDSTSESSQSFRVLALRTDGTTKDVTLLAKATVPPEAPFIYTPGTVIARPILYGDKWLILRYNGASVAVQVSVTRKPLIQGERETGMLEEGGDLYPFETEHVYDPGEPSPWVNDK